MAQQSVVVVGAGVAGLVAARDLARKGFGVTVLDPAPRAGGCVATHTVAGIRLDSGAESFATRGGTVSRYLTELGLGGDQVTPTVSGAWVQLDGFAAPLPKNTLLGIPGVPLADDVRRIIGWRAALRAQLDRYMPLLRVRPEADLGDLVRRRMGQTVLDRLVAPIVSGVHSAHPDLVDVQAVAPGLTSAMTSQGSLSGAVMSLLARRPGVPAQAARASAATAQATPASATPASAAAATGRAASDPAAPDPFATDPATTDPAATDPATGGRPELAAAGGARAGSAVGGLDGGMYRLVEALVADCLRLGVDLRLGTGVRALRRVPNTAAGAPLRPADPASAGSGPTAPAAPGPRHAPAEWLTVLDDGSVLGSHGVVVAAGFRAALGLLRGLGGLDDETREDVWPGSSAVTLATLVLDAPELDAAPRGTGVLVAEDVTTVLAKALTHATAKWPWLAREAGPGHHVVRLSYGRGGQPPPTVTLSQALADASTLLDTPLSAEQVRGFALTDWKDSLAFATGGHRARVEALVEAVHEHPGLEVVGAWISGTGLAYVIDGSRVKASELAVRMHSS